MRQSCRCGGRFAWLLRPYTLQDVDQLWTCDTFQPVQSSVYSRPLSIQMGGLTLPLKGKGDLHHRFSPFL